MSDPACHSVMLSIYPSSFLWEDPLWAPPLKHDFWAAQANFKQLSFLGKKFKFFFFFLPPQNFSHFHFFMHFWMFHAILSVKFQPKFFFTQNFSSMSCGWSKAWYNATKHSSFLLFPPPTVFFYSWETQCWINWCTTLFHSLMSKSGFFCIHLRGSFGDDSFSWEYNGQYITISSLGGRAKPVKTKALFSVRAAQLSMLSSMVESVCLSKTMMTKLELHLVLYCTLLHPQLIKEKL